MRLSIRFPTPEDYAGWAGSGAFGGWAETLDRLAERRRRAVRRARLTRI